MTEIVFGNYNLKRRIEKLILWFLPAFVLSATFQFFYQKFMKHTVEQAIVEGAKIGNSISSAMLASYGIGFLDNIVVAIWLYFQSRDLKYNKLLWPILGLFDISIALIAFMGVTLSILTKKIHLTIKSTGLIDAGALLEENFRIRSVVSQPVINNVEAV